MTLRTVFFSLALTVTSPAFAQDAGDDTPDASVGSGGADQMTQEGDETGPNGTCSLNRDCERGFTCVNGACRYAGYRMAEQVGCSAVPGLAIASLLVVTLPGRRRLRRRP
jgi:hypothetical protein